MILVINSGSSSLKFKLFKKSNLTPISKGIVDGIGLKTCFIEIQSPEGHIQQKKKIKNHKSALQEVLAHIPYYQITAIGHRVVHGGETYTSPILIDRKVLKTIKQLCTLAPLHNPANLEGILACQKLLKKVPNIAVFDTAFHQSIPEQNYLYALPYKFYRQHHIRKYGFHGINHQHVTTQALKLLKQKYSSSKKLISQSANQPKIISCHLGNGASIAASINGKCLDTSMGFTPLEGLIMGTRSGDIDPAIIPYLITQKKFSAKQIDQILNHESGLKGLSELSSDMRILHETKTHKPQATRAINAFTARIIKYIGAYTAMMNGVDAIIFTAGIGEKAWYIRRDVCKSLEYLGLKIDNTKNRKSATAIHTPSSKVKVYILPANEELEIAKATKEIISK